MKIFYFNLTSLQNASENGFFHRPRWKGISIFGCKSSTLISKILHLAQFNKNKDFKNKYFTIRL